MKAKKSILIMVPNSIMVVYMDPLAVESFMIRIGRLQTVPSSVLVYQMLL